MAPHEPHRRWLSTASGRTTRLANTADALFYTLRRARLEARVLSA